MLRAAAAIETQDAEIASKIEVAEHAVADLDARVAQIESAIAEATRRAPIRNFAGCCLDPSTSMAVVAKRDQQLSAS